MLKRVVAIALILIMVFELRVVTSLAQDNDSNNFKNEKNQEYDYLSIPVSLFGGKSNNEELMIYNGYVYADIKELSNKLGLVYNSYNEYSNTKGENDQNKLILEFKKGYAESFSDADPSSLEIRIRKQNSSLVFYFRPGSQNAFAYSIHFGKYCYNMGSPVLVSKGKTWVPLASFLFLFDSYCYVDEEKLNIGRSALTVIDILHRVDLENYHFDIVDQYGGNKWVFLAKTGYSDYYKRVKNFVSGGLSFDIEKMRKTVTYDDVADVLSLQLYTANTSEIESIQDEYKDIGLVSDATVALSDSLVELSETISTGTLNDAETYISYFDHLMDNNYYCTIADIQRAGKQASQVVQKSSNASAINNIMSSTGKVITYGAAAFSVYLSYITYINEIDSANKNYIPAVQKYIDYYSNTNTNGLSRDLMELIRKKGDLYKNSKNIFDNEELLSAISSSIANNAIKLNAGLAIAQVLPTVIGAGLIATIGWDVSETIVNHISGAAFTHIDSAENTFFAMKLESDTERTLKLYKYSIMYENAYDFDTYRYLEWVRLKSYCIAREDAIQYSQRLLKKYPNEIGDVISRWRSEESVLNNLMSVLISGTHEGITPEKIKQASKKTDAMNLEIGDQVKQLNQNIKSEGSYYLQVILEKMKEYGSLRIVHNNGDWENEANGLCYLNLVDFTGDGKDELFAVCKKEDEKHYTGYIYTITKEGPKLLHEISQTEYSVRGCDIVNVGYTADTGFIYGTGWEGADADDMTFFWYRNGNFEPVYRYKGYWDGDLEDEIVDEEAIIVDLFDDEHRDEYYNNFPEVTLRTPDDTNSKGDYFDSSELQKTIDDVIRKLGIDLSDLPSTITFSEERLKDLSLVAIYHCIEDDLDEWIPDIKDTETFWDVMCFYCDFTDRISSSNYPIVGEDVGFQAIPNNILKNVAYAVYKDFDGNLPTIDSDVWRANYYNDEATGIIVGDDAPIIVTSEDYQQNEDGTIDAVYDIEYVGEFPAGTYKVHFEPNTHHNEVDADAAFYYRVSYVEVLEKPSISNDSDSEELTMEEYGIPYGHYYGGKPQGEGVFGLDMDLYEDMTFSIVSAFDLFSDEDGDEYVYTGTYKIDRVNDEGNPVLRLHCDEGDYEFVWDGEELFNDSIFAQYEGELSTPDEGNSNHTAPEEEYGTAQITDISQVVEKDLNAVDAAHILDLEYDVIEDDYHYFYQDTTCDEKQGMLWCDDYQKEEINNWKYNPGETGIAIYGVVSGMSRESLLSLMENQHFSATDYFGGEDDGNLYYTVNKDQFVIGVKLESDIVADVTIFSAANY